MVKVLRSLSEDVEAVCLVKECSELERAFGTQCIRRGYQKRVVKCPHNS